MSEPPADLTCHVPCLSPGQQSCSNLGALGQALPELLGQTSMGYSRPTAPHPQCVWEWSWRPSSDSSPSSSPRLESPPELFLDTGTCQQQGRQAGAGGTWQVGGALRQGLRHLWALPTSEGGKDPAPRKGVCTQAPLNLPQMRKSREHRQKGSGGRTPGPGLWAACHSCGSVGDSKQPYWPANVFLGEKNSKAAASGEKLVRETNSPESC